MSGVPTREVGTLLPAPFRGPFYPAIPCLPSSLPRPNDKAIYMFPYIFIAVFKPRLLQDIALARLRSLLSGET